MLTVVQAATIAVALGFGTVGVWTIVTGRVVFPGFAAVCGDRLSGAWERF